MGDEMATEQPAPAPRPVGLMQAVVYFLMAAGHFLNTITPIIQIGFSQFMEIRNAVAQPATNPADVQPGRAGDSPVSGRSAAAAAAASRQG
jgi:hypothetical protein